MSMKVLKIIFFPITLLVYLFIWIGRQINKIFIGMFFKKVTISKIDALSGEEFENICKLIFKYVGYKVTMTPKSNDYGADLILNKRYKFVVQAKLYYNHGVGNKAVQEVTSALKYYQAQFAVVITNWHFTRQAKDMAEIQNVILIERQDILDFLNDVKFRTKKSKVFDLIAHYKVHVEKY